MLRVLLRGGVVALTSLIALLVVVATHTSSAQPIYPQPESINTTSDVLHTTAAFTIGLRYVVGGLSAPVHITHAGDGSGRLFVVQQGGQVRVIKNGVLLSTPFLDISSLVSCCGEQGLLSIAFDPNYATNGIFYVYYTDNSGNVAVARYVVSNPASDVAAVVNVTPILNVEHPQGNHNGGQLQFGPHDGYLYLGIGDGGAAGDQGSGHHEPGGNGQYPGTLLGKLLRINVRGVPTYTIPTTNPFAQTAGYLPEIWALGLRNPWRFSFDRLTGDLFIGDVGQDCYEEIDYQPAASHGGENYGWRRMEGYHAFDPANMLNCNQPTPTPTDVTLPIVEIPHPDAEAIVGGYVYRGNAYPGIQGVYFYADEIMGRLWAIEHVNSTWVNATDISSPGISSFGEDDNGELYAADYNGGAIYQVVSAPGAAPSIDLSTSTKSVSPSTAQHNDTVSYTIVLRNTGDAFNNTMHVTDTVPNGLTYVSGSFAATSGAVDASAAPTLKWQGSMGSTPAITLSFAAKVNVLTAQTITNSVQINPVLSPTLTRSAALHVLNAPPDFSPSTKQASLGAVTSGATVTYAIVLRNVGGPATSTAHLTDTIPAGLNYIPGTLAATLGSVDQSAAPTLKWQGVLGSTPMVTVTYAVTVSVVSPIALTNNVMINSGAAAPFTRSVTIVANGIRVFLPIVLRNF